MRLYSFANYYLSSLQQGLQTAHVVSELFAYYPHNDKLIDWATHHKTIIILNGGNSADLVSIGTKLGVIGHQLNLPNAFFREDGESLNWSPTACGIIVPAHVYEFAAVRVFTEDNMHLYDTVTETEQELAAVLKSYPLAR